MPRVSIIMSVYNQEPYLNESVDSILCQEFKDWQLIAVNDGSVDNSLDILRSYQDKRIKILENDGNKGLIYSLNRALQNCNDCEYIARMDSDDISLPNRLAIQLSIMESTPQIDILGSAIKFFGDTTKTRFVPDTNGKIIASLFFFNPLMHPTIMFKQALLSEGFVYDREYNKYEDYALWIKMANKINFANTNNILLNYRRHNNNITGQYEKDVEYHNSTYYKLLNKLDKNFELNLSNSCRSVLTGLNDKTLLQLDQLSFHEMGLAVEEIVEKCKKTAIDTEYLKRVFNYRMFVYFLKCKRYADIKNLLLSNKPITSYKMLMAGKFPQMN